MPTISKQTDLDAPPEQVWTALTDFSRYGDWNVVHAGFPDGPPASVSQGQTFKEKVKIMGMPGEVTWTVEELQENAALTLDGKGPMGTSMRYAYRISPAAGGSRLDLDSEFGGAALGALAGALTKESEKALGESLEKFKALL